jgi:hypothetical protein
MVKKKEKMQKRPAGLVINPPAPRPIDRDHPNNYLFPQTNDSIEKVDHSDRISIEQSKVEIEQDQQEIEQDQQNLDVTQSTVNPVHSELGSLNPVHNEPSSQRTQSVKITTSKSFTSPVNLIEVGGYKTPNFLDDELLPDLAPAEQVVLRRLYRLSYGFNRQTTDSVGINKLAKKCNLGESTVKRALKALSDRGLIIIHLDDSNSPKGGNKYSVLTGFIMNPVHNEPSSSRTGFTVTSIIDDDHDDLKEQDHHLNEHKKEVMMIYQKLTGNKWTERDNTSYRKIGKVPIGIIETTLRIANQRAASHPNSLSYFVKEIINAANPAPANRAQQKKKMQQIVERVLTSYVGSSNYTPSDVVYKVKEFCVKEDIPFDNDVFNDIFDKRKR